MSGFKDVFSYCLAFNVSCGTSFSWFCAKYYEFHYSVPVPLNNTVHWNWHHIHSCFVVIVPCKNSNAHAVSTLL